LIILDLEMILSKLKTFINQRTVSREQMTQQPAEWEKTFVYHTFYKGYIKNYNSTTRKP
jgi:hypothetical protein